MSMGPETTDEFERLHPDLPIYGVPNGDRYIVYSPGRTVILATQQEVGTAVAAIEAHAASVKERWARATTAPFSPECLTVYLSNRCNCRCLYCYAAACREDDGETVAPEAVGAAAEVVAESCAAKGQRFRLVAHGGGEPTVHPELLRRIVADTRAAARDCGIEWRGYIATNGVMSEEQAAWVAENFDAAGVSHDGPPDLHDRQRPLPDGRSSLGAVERTIGILRDRGIDVSVRTTLLPEAVDRQREVVEYLVGRLGVTRVRLEPVYVGRREGGRAFAPNDAERFAERFLEAQRRAGELGGELSLSGIRMNELHGPYCNVLRSALHLVPGTAATACFFVTDAASASAAGAGIGEWDPEAGTFRLDRELIGKLCAGAGAIPAECESCICAYHCSRGCPDVCVVQEGVAAGVGGFRCRVARLLAVGWLRGSGAGLPSGS